MIPALGLLAGIGTRVVHTREFGGAVATHWVTPPPDTTHHVDRSLHLLAAIGVPLRGRTPSLRVPDAAYDEADSLIADVLDPAGATAPMRTINRADRPAPLWLHPSPTAPARSAERQVR